MAFQSADTFARWGCPQLDRLVITAGGEGLSIGAKSHGPHRFKMTRAEQYDLSGCHIPNLYSALTISNGNLVARLTEGYRVNSSNGLRQ